MSKYLYIISTNAPLTLLDISLNCILRQA